MQMCEKYIVVVIHVSFNYRNMIVEVTLSTVQYIYIDFILQMMHQRKKSVG